MRARALFAALLFAVSCACFAQGAASVVFASGNAQIMGVDGKSRSAMRGGELVVGETVDTGSGRVQLRFFDGAEMSLQPATRFRVDEFRFALQDGEARAEQGARARAGGIRVAQQLQRGVEQQGEPGKQPEQRGFT